MKKQLRKIREHHRKIALTAAVVLCVILGVAAIAGAMLADGFHDRILPNTVVGGIDLGGKTREEATSILNRTFDAYIGNGFSFVADGKEIELDRVNFGLTDPDLTNDAVRLDTDTTVGRAFGRGHEGNVLRRWIATGLSFVSRDRVALETTVNRGGIASVLRARLAELETPLVEPVLRWKDGAFVVDPGKPGRLYDIDSGIDALERQFHELKSASVTLSARDVRPSVSDDAARAIAPKAAELVKAGPLTLTATVGKEERSWTFETAALARWIIAEKKGDDVTIGVDPAALSASLAGARDVIDVDAVDAKFEIKDGRVVTFEPSREGRTIEEAALADRLEDEWVGKRSASVAIPVVVAAPKVTTASSNTLGVKELLGVGTSNYAGSPVNRIKNIRNSVRKLNGILIPPDGEFSLLAALRPFTIEGGYLPEKVIKGNKIEPEIGGGACQIGTTTFRATMNSGLPVVERQNHSLVVRYYNDPSNGNPGTDATIYDASPDFRFMNDTGHHILFLAAMDDAKSELRFSFWGTGDGRNGFYSKPVVLRWISPGETQEIKTADIAPGVRECQNAFRGADTSFTYTVEKPDGTKEERVFTSHYRALPQICLVGATAEEIAGSTTPPPGEIIPTADIPVPPPTNQPVQ